MKDNVEYYVFTKENNEIIAISYTLASQRLSYQLSLPGNYYIKQIMKKISVAEYLELKAKYFKGIEEVKFHIRGNYAFSRLMY